MGGKLFNVPRLTDSEYKFAKLDIIEMLYDNSFHYQYDFIKTYSDKQTHGDIDILVKCENKNDLRYTINFIFEEYQCKNTNHGISVNFNNKQIDFISISNINYDYSLYYYRYSSLNEIIGKFCIKHNLIYKNNGLYYRYKGLYKPKDIFLSKNVIKIYNFLDISELNHIFEKTYNEIFNIITNSCYFDYNRMSKKISKLTQVNDTYKKFDIFLKNNTIKAGINYSINIDYLEKEFEADLTNRINKIKSDEEKYSKIEGLINGKEIMKITSLKGKELSKFIGDFKNYLKINNKYYNLYEYNVVDLINEFYKKENVF